LVSELLTYWFEEDRDGPKFHLCQQQAIETVIYCHEILGIQNPFQLYQQFSSDHPRVQEATRSKPLQDELNPITFPKYCLKMATGSGKGLSRYKGKKVQDRLETPSLQKFQLL